MLGNFLSCSKGVRTLWKFQRLGVISLEKPQLKWASSRLEGRTSWIFSSWGRSLSSYDGDLRDPLCWAQERPVPMRVARGPLGIPLPSMPGPKILCGVVPEPEHSSSVLTWILGYFWSLPRGVSPRLERGHARALSSRAVAAVSRFPSRGSRDLWLSLEAFPRGLPTGLSHVPPRCESILGLKVEAVQGKQFSPEWTETSGGFWERWHDPGVPLAFPVESASS